MSSVSPLFQQLLQLGRLPPFESLDGSESCFDALDLRFGPTCNQSNFVCNANGIMNFEHCFQITISCLNWKIRYQIRCNSCEISDFKIRFNLNFTAKRVEPQQLGPAEQLKRRQALSTIVSTIGLLKNTKAAAIIYRKKSQHCRSLQSEAAFSSLFDIDKTAPQQNRFYDWLFKIT